MFRSNAALPGKKFWSSVALTAAALVAFSPAARAQSFFDVFEPSPQHIQRGLAASGFELRGPLTRRGDVYVADVATGSGEDYRLVVDARNGRILERFAAQRVRRVERNDEGLYAERDLRNGWDQPPRPPAVVAPRPGILGLFLDDRGDAPPRGADPHDQIARGNFMPPSEIYGDDMKAPAPRADKPKHVVRRKVAPPVKAASTVVEPGAPDASTTRQAVGVAPANDAPQPVVAPNPAPGVAAPAIEQPKSNEAAKPDESATPAPSIKPAEAAPADVAPKPAETAKAVEPSETAKPTAETKPVEAPKPVAETKAAEPVKPIVEVKAAPGPRAASKPKAVNDLPVTPLD